MKNFPLGNYFSGGCFARTARKTFEIFLEFSSKFFPLLFVEKLKKSPFMINIFALNRKKCKNLLSLSKILKKAFA